MVCDGYVKYEEAEVDRLLDILKTNNCGGGGGGVGVISHGNQPASAKAAE